MPPGVPVCDPVVKSRTTLKMALRSLTGWDVGVIASQGALAEVSEASVIDWDHIYILAWYDHDGKGYLSSWQGDYPKVYVLVEGLRSGPLGFVQMPMWNAPVPEGVTLREIDQELPFQDMLGVSRDRDALLALAWVMPEVIDRTPRTEPEDPYEAARARGAYETKPEPVSELQRLAQQEERDRHKAWQQQTRAAFEGDGLPPWPSRDITQIDPPLRDKLVLWDKADLREMATSAVEGLAEDPDGVATLLDTVQGMLVGHVHHVTLEQTAIRGFTLGRRSSYERSRREGPGPMLKCEGGWVFRTYESALFFREAHIGHDFGDFVLDASFAVYGLALPRGWERDVSMRPDADGVHRLLADVPLVYLP